MKSREILSFILGTLAGIILAFVPFPLNAMFAALMFVLVFAVLRFVWRGHIS